MMTRGEQMLALRRSRMASSPPILRGGFRPFFFGGAAWGLIALVLWLCSLAGKLNLPTAFDPVAWHRHEMLFGFVGAVISGFLLTAIPNWTGRLPIAGKPLAGLVGLWLVSRLAVLFSASYGLLPAAILDAGFFFVLAMLAAREVLESKNRNMPIVGMVMLFGLADATDYASAAGWIDADLGWKLAVSLVVLLISLIGGRIIPSFTRNWMAKRKMGGHLPTQAGRFDLFVIGATAFALLWWLSAPAGLVTGVILLAVALLQLARLARWSGWRTFADPLVLILHVGYLWLPVGIALLGLFEAGVAIPRSAAIHALTAGAMTTMILAVMTRASLGHTARALKANGLTVLLYALVTAGAILRVLASLGVIANYEVALHVAGTAWAGALLVFLIAYAPVLWGPRLGEKA